jgi:hypothetical protein
LAAGGLWLAGAGRAADKGDAPPKEGGSELDLVPADGMAVISVRLGDLWNNAAFKAAWEKAAKEAPDFQEHVNHSLGVQPGDVERVTTLWPSVEAGGRAWMAFVTTAKAYDSAKVGAAAVPDGKEDKVSGRKVRADGEHMAVAFLTDRTYLIGPADEVREYLKTPQQAKEGPLTPALREAAGKHAVAAGLNVEALAKAAPANPPSPDEAAFLPLLKADQAVLTIDVGDEAKATVRVTFEGEKSAKGGEEAANAVLDMARAALVKQLQEMEKHKELAGVVGLVKNVQAGLRAAKVERNGPVVEVAAAVKLDMEKTGAELIDGIQKVREASARMQSANNLKQLALAMHNYHDTYNHFPAAAITDKNGKPLLSWRVEILPYIEQDKLYKQFHLDEPWDSDNNKKLLEQMPKVFAAPAQSETSLKNHETPYQGFIGKGAFFEGIKGIKAADITDGMSNTIMFVEAAKTVPWSKPDDVPFDEGKLLPKVGGLSPRIFQAAMCDGSVRGIPMAIKEETLRAAITRNGGEVLGPDW